MSNREITRQEVEPLLRDSPLRERIDYLLDNQDLGKRVLGKFGPKDNLGDVFPNCFGTTLFVVGAQERFLATFGNPKNTRRGFYIGNIEKPYFAFFPRKLDGPGGLEPSFMKGFFDSSCISVNRNRLSNGDIVSIPGGYMGFFYADPVHTAIYLGKIDGTGLVFHQDGRRADFTFDTLDKVCNRKYADKDKIKFYRFNPKGVENG
ncbi:MAG: hypothetical protein Q7R87_03800 [Nanoarchaeota archaeon]|nr:hypothetical protein [Nanoarchaeota archaeon]